MLSLDGFLEVHQIYEGKGKAKRVPAHPPNLCQLLCCAKQKGSGPTTVQLPLMVPLHLLLSGSAGWPYWRCTTVTVPNMVWLSVPVRAVPYQRWSWWCFSGVGNHRYFNQKPNSALYGSYLCALLPLSIPSCFSTLTRDRDLELHIQSLFMPSSANKTCVEIH